MIFLSLWYLLNRSSFRVVKNSNIDGVSDTDGIEIVNTYLNKDFPKGLIVVQDGKNTGEIKIYFENGDLKVSKDYINDSTLRYKSWYENNQLHKRGNYQNNLKTGEWISWDKNGKPMLKGEFNNGKEIGIHFLFIENKLVSKTYYDNFGNNYKSIYYPLNSTSSYSLPYDSIINIYDEGKILKTRFYKYGKIESELDK